jgi:hypothetical protein
MAAELNVVQVQSPKQTVFINCAVILFMIGDCNFHYDVTLKLHAYFIFSYIIF